LDHEDHINSFNDIQTIKTLSFIEKSYNKKIKFYAEKSEQEEDEYTDKLIYKSQYEIKFIINELLNLYIKNLLNNSNIYNIYSDENFNYSNLIRSKEFINYYLENTSIFNEDNISKLKQYQYVNFSNFLNMLNVNTNYINPYSYTTLLNSFRTSFDETH